MTNRPRTQKRSVLRLVLYALVLLTLVIAFLYAYELIGGLVDSMLEFVGDIIGQL